VQPIIEENKKKEEELTVLMNDKLEKA